MRFGPFLLLCVSVALASACAGRGPSVSESDSRVALARRGEQVFRDNCNVCHPNGGKGLGPALERSIVRESQITQIRKGFGLMPSFSEEKISDEDVEAVLAYVDGLVVRAKAEKERHDAIEAERKKLDAANDAIEMVDNLTGNQEPPPETIDSTSQIR